MITLPDGVEARSVFKLTFKKAKRWGWYCHVSEWTADDHYVRELGCGWSLTFKGAMHDTEYTLGNRLVAEAYKDETRVMVQYK